MKKIIAFFLFAIIMVLTFLSGCGAPKDYTEFAKCLTDAGVTMYGAAWCPHCKTVKKDFGDAFQYVNYVECDAATPGSDPQKCEDAKIEFLPTFFFADKTRLFGDVSFEILSGKTGCALPNNTVSYHFEKDVTYEKNFSANLGGKINK